MTRKQTKKVLVIVGPTATGKSALAVRLARKIDGEIISADSRQVYKGLDIGSGKITKREMKGVPHHLLDVVSPKKYYSVELFKEAGRAAMEKIWSRGRTPIVCGGTGFYIDALLNQTSFPNVPPNNKLRRELAKKNTMQLFARLRRLDPRRANNIDSNNKVRLIRAIEIAEAIGHVPNLVRRGGPSWDIFKIGLRLTPEKLKKKISVRLLARIRQGMIDEVRTLHKSGVTWKRLNEFGLEYRYVAKYLKEFPRLSASSPCVSALKAELSKEIWRYAKRQMTWFKRDKEIVWFSPRDYRKIASRVNKF